ncbi:MAG: MarR family transcriptional regulator [Ignavibacteria bacterium]|nr:MAG: MarR family transcriptional regulator [Ignavibacteria bacterium]
MGTHYKGTKKEIRALNTYIKFMRAADSLSSRINSRLIKTKLSESQLNVLDALFHLGPLSQKDLGKKLLRSGGNITMVIDNLEKRKFVRRKRGVTDRRIIIVDLTPSGKKLMGKVLPQKVDAVTKEIIKLSKDEQSELQRLCKKIGIRKQ